MSRRAHPRREAILDDIEKGTLQKIVLYKYGISEYMYSYFKKTYFTTELVRVKYDDQRQLELDI